MKHDCVQTKNICKLGSWGREHMGDFGIVINSYFRTIKGDNGTIDREPNGASAQALGVTFPVIFHATEVNYQL